MTIGTSAIYLENDKHLDGAVMSNPNNIKSKAKYSSRVEYVESYSHRDYIILEFKIKNCPVGLFWDLDHGCTRVLESKWVVR
jgi:hypothetical protein